MSKTIDISILLITRIFLTQLLKKNPKNVSVQLPVIQMSLIVPYLISFYLSNAVLFHIQTLLPPDQS